MLRWESLSNKISIRDLDLDLVTEKVTQFRQSANMRMVTRSDGPGREKVKGWTSFKEIFFRSVCHMIGHVSDALGTREPMLTLFCTQLLFNRIQLVPESGYF